MRRIILVSLLLLVLVIPHVVQADTLLKYLDVDTADEYMYETTDAAFSTMRNAAGDGSGDNGQASANLFLVASTTEGVYSLFSRMGYGFNTSSIGSSATVTNVVFSWVTSSLLSNVKAGGLCEDSVGISGFAPATYNNFGTGDYDAFTNTEYASRISYGDYPGITKTRVNWTFNEDGRNAINKNPAVNGGYTNFMMRFGADLDNSDACLVWASAGENHWGSYDYTEYAGREPFLEITYTSGATPPVASFTVDKNFVRIPGSVQFTDTSSNTPTSWEWNFGDGTANSTVQNPVHQYLKRGRFDVVLTATNAGGSNTSGSASVRVVGYENYY